MDIDNLIDQFVEDLDFDALCAWAEILDVDVSPPPLDDMWPDWDSELRVEVGDAMREVGQKARQEKDDGLQWVLHSVKVNH